MKKRIFNLFMLFVSKSGAVLVGIIFLPWYRDLLGDTVFGIVAVILSFQALLIMLDLGMATILSRDIAAREYMPAAFNPLQAFKQAERLLVFFYGLLFFILLLWFYVVQPQYLQLSNIVSLVLLFFVLVQQNIALAALIALKAYALASSIQLLAVVSRALATVCVLQGVEASLSMFIWAQLGVALCFFLLTRWQCEQKLPSDKRSFIIRRKHLMALLRRGKPLLLMGLAGAAVMQLDKPFILYFMTASEVGTYFLAISFAMLPLFVLAAPVAQFFQPKITELIAGGELLQSYRLLVYMFVALLLVVMLPSAIIWLLRDEILMLWLHDASLVSTVSEYVSILIWGAACGAFGYIPYQILVALQDFSFQAKLSAVLAVVTLSIVAFSAYFGNIIWICMAYVFYHLATVACLSLRSCMILKNHKDVKNGK